MTLVSMFPSNKLALNSPQFLSKSYRTALIWAAERGEMELVKLLLDKGANTFNPVVLNGVSDYVKLSLDKIVGEKERARRREILRW